MACYKCGGDLIKKKVDWVNYVNGIKVVTPNIIVDECSICGETLIHSEQAEIIDKEVEKYFDKELALEVSLKNIRENLGLTQEEIGERMGFSKSRYNNIEKSKKKPSILLALKLANALECDVNEIYKLKVTTRKSKFPGHSEADQCHAEALPRPNA